MWQAWHNFYDLVDYPWLILSALFALGAILLHLRIRQWLTPYSSFLCVCDSRDDAWNAIATFVERNAEHSMFCNMAGTVPIVGHFTFRNLAPNMNTLFSGWFLLVCNPASVPIEPIDEANRPIAMQLQGVCHHTLRWLISFWLDAVPAITRLDPDERGLVVSGVVVALTAFGLLVDGYERYYRGPKQSALFGILWQCTSGCYHHHLPIEPTSQRPGFD